MSEAMWGGRFTKTVDEMVNEFQASINFDKRMYHEDIAGSIAHAIMLAKCGIISDDDCGAILQGLKDIEAQIEAGEFDFSVDLEDIHMNIEKRLTEAIGEAGGRLHTARSRNDQVALDTHMYIRREVVAVQKEIINLQEALLETAKKNQDVIMPGYTHLQRAQPILFAHHLMAYFGMLSRDYARFSGVYQRADIMPLGAGALAGTTFPIDRELVAKQLNFEQIYSNSLDAVSDRDYIMEFLSAASILMVHLSRLSEETILWCSREFSFVELDDAHCTGSSMMPQKKNPDVSELVRGKTGRVIGHLMAMLTTVKGLPLAYNKDLQEDKEGIFDAIDTVKFSLGVYAQLIRGMKVKKDVMRKAVEEDFSNATDLADYLVKKGMPFRQAHAVSGTAVHKCIAEGKYLADMTLPELQELSPLFEADIAEALKPETCVNQRISLGGTSTEQVKLQLTAAQELIDAEKKTNTNLTSQQI
ncbi:argininosuccinate lyase [Selenomonas ruminantium]|uniref:Argininosuccinate lyase n=2 Tax=Selenomonas ruminantium TaxID=971 RepID=A0A1K1M1A0_SELRU|nr:argininosuccinate lyase [Selenomonas ruminantium]SFA73544.1 argininosuccinate lyase [Selenomonas ruminantium]SFW16906.1 argininosuccinate lyase [Selenomonas ruminantium]